MLPLAHALPRLPRLPVYSPLTRYAIACLNHGRVHAGEDLGMWHLSYCLVGVPYRTRRQLLSYLFGRAEARFPSRKPMARLRCISRRGRRFWKPNTPSVGKKRPTTEPLSTHCTFRSPRIDCDHGSRGYRIVLAGVAGRWPLSLGMVQERRRRGLDTALRAYVARCTAALSVQGMAAKRAEGICGCMSTGLAEEFLPESAAGFGKMMQADADPNGSPDDRPLARGETSRVMVRLNDGADSPNLQ